MSAGTRKVQWSTLAAPSSTASRTPGRGELVPVPGARGRHRAGLEHGTASSPSKACGLAGSQKTSIQRASGAQAVSISPVTSSM